MADLTWRKAIVQVLQSHAEPMHYADIAAEIQDRGLRTNLGATPANSVASIITKEIKKKGDKADFEKVDAGTYRIRPGSPFAKKTQQANRSKKAASTDKDQVGFVNAFGIYWQRSWVDWKKPQLLGQQQKGATNVDFAEQKGVYLLHDVNGVVYVGRCTERYLSQRLKEHTADRLNGRWDRFSWFGVRPVTEKGKLKNIDLSKLTDSDIIVTMEALLIEGLEPRQNRKRGDDFRGVEYLQVRDPSIEGKELLSTLQELLNKGR